MSNQTQQEYPSETEPAANPDYQAEHFVVQRRGDLSLQDLCDLRDAGAPVLRSSHLGNQALYNGALLQAGLRAALYDRTVPAKDRNYHPGDEIRSGKPKRIIDEMSAHRLTTHISTKATPEQPSRSLTEVHTESLRRAFPNAPVQTMSEYLGGDETRLRILNETVRCLVAHDFGAWNRRVDAEGKLHEVVTGPGSAAEAVKRYGVFRDGSDKSEQEGMLLPNEYNVLLTGIMDALEYGTDQVYHLSGPDMIHYIVNMAPTLDQMYARVRAECSFGQQLPARLHFNIVPTAYNKFVATSDLAYELDQVIDAYQNWQKSVQMQPNRKRAAALLPHSSYAEQRQRTRQLERIGWEGAREKAVARAIAELCPWLFATTQSRAYPTHHDVADAARGGFGYDGLYVPDFSRHTPFDELGVAFRALHRLVADTQAVPDKGGNK